MTDWPSVTLIVLNYNTSHIVPDCLRALQALDYPDFKLQLVDNASTDGSVKKLSAQFPSLTILANQHNLGFAAGNNTALKNLQTEVAVLVNPDVIVPKNWLKLLMVPFMQDPTIGIVGCKLLYPDSNLIQHAGGFMTMPQALPGHFGLREEDVGQFDTLRDVDYVIGAAFAIRQEVVETIGLMDEGYFLYFEETDYCYQARNAGFRVVYVPEATAVHLESISVKRATPAYFARMHQSRWRFLLKHVALAQIMSQTVPAEKAWLATLPAFHRQAAADSYTQTRRQLTQVIQMVHPAASKVAIQQLDRQLVQLTIAARQTTISVDSNQFWLDFKRAATIEEPKFSSSVPLVGGLIASFRTWWNGVETRPYTQPILQQLFEWNETVIEKLSQHQQTLATHEADLTAIAVEIDKIKGEVKQVNKMLAYLEGQSLK